ncbi:hypothetical protein BGZ99_001474 [Dissophora globulifera]|uniref:Uncharacterized protein n=1 Tax=Dissophora globulifera TaxID=979702 RepID=A0A9P6RNS2_9FUNG|nr:hypothetical protein BGZ99_001474 [Dissophora globulifera]
MPRSVSRGASLTGQHRQHILNRNSSTPTSATTTTNRNPPSFGRYGNTNGVLRHPPRFRSPVFNLTQEDEDLEDYSDQDDDNEEDEEDESSESVAQSDTGTDEQDEYISDSKKTSTSSIMKTPSDIITITDTDEEFGSDSGTDDWVPRLHDTLTERDRSRFPTTGEVSGENSDSDVSVIEIDPYANLDELRATSLGRLAQAWMDIFERYGKDVAELPPDDEIDLRTGQLIVDNGVLRGQPKTLFGSLTSLGKELKKPLRQERQHLLTDPVPAPEKDHTPQPTRHRHSRRSPSLQAQDKTVFVTRIGGRKQWYHRRDEVNNIMPTPPVPSSANWDTPTLPRPLLDLYPIADDLLSAQSPSHIQRRLDSKLPLEDMPAEQDLDAMTVGEDESDDEDMENQSERDDDEEDGENWWKEDELPRPSSPSERQRTRRQELMLYQGPPTISDSESLDDMEKVDTDSTKIDNPLDRRISSFTAVRGDVVGLRRRLDITITDEPIEQVYEIEAQDDTEPDDYRQSEISDDTETEDLPDASEHGELYNSFMHQPPAIDNIAVTQASDEEEDDHFENNIITELEDIRYHQSTPRRQQKHWAAPDHQGLSMTAPAGLERDRWEGHTDAIDQTAIAMSTPKKRGLERDEVDGSWFSPSWRKLVPPMAYLAEEGSEDERIEEKLDEDEDEDFVPEPRYDPSLRTPQRLAASLRFGKELKLKSMPPFSRLDSSRPAMQPKAKALLDLLMSKKPLGHATVPSSSTIYSTASLASSVSPQPSPVKRHRPSLILDESWTRELEEAFM